MALTERIEFKATKEDKRFVARIAKKNRISIGEAVRRCIGVVRQTEPYVKRHEIK